jgi:hypothetical protein
MPRAPSKTGHWLLLSALPIERVAPTPYQRELSKTHAQRLSDVILKGIRDAVTAQVASSFRWPCRCDS